MRWGCGGREWENSGRKRPGRGPPGWDRRAPGEFSPAIIPGHPYWRDLAGPLMDIEGGGVAYLDTAVAEIHRAFRVARKARKEVLSYRYHLVRLSAYVRHLPCYDHITTVAQHPSKRVARKRT